MGRGGAQPTVPSGAGLFALCCGVDFVTGAAFCTVDSERSAWTAGLFVWQAPRWTLWTLLTQILAGAGMPSKKIKSDGLSESFFISHFPIAPLQR